MTVPGYPVAGTHARVLRWRGTPVAAAGEENNFLPDLDEIPEDDRHACQAAGAQLPQQPHGCLGDQKSSSAR